jgi:hypothetical protein
LIHKGRLSVLFLGIAAVFSLFKGISAAYLLSLEAFGNYSVIMSFVIISVLLFSFSVEPRYLRSGSRVLSFSKDVRAFDAHFLRYSSALIWNFFFLLFPVFFIVYAFELSNYVILLIILFSFLSAHFNLSLSSIRLAGNYIAYSCMLLYRSLSVICIYFLVPNELLNAEIFILIEIVVCVVGYLYINFSKLKVVRCTIINFRLYKTILKAGWGFSSSYLARTGLIMIDRPVVALVQGGAVVGLFSIYLIPTQIAIGLVGLLSVYLQPWGLACNNTGDVTKLKKFINLYLRYFTIFFVLVLVAFYSYFDFLQSYISYELNIQEFMLSLSISLLILLNIFDPFYLVLGKGKEQFILSLIFAFCYCLTLLVYYYFELEYLILLWSLFVLRVGALIYGFMYIGSELNKRMLMK